MVFVFMVLVSACNHRKVLISKDIFSGWFSFFDPLSGHYPSPGEIIYRNKSGYIVILADNGYRRKLLVNAI